MYDIMELQSRETLWELTTKKERIMKKLLCITGLLAAVLFVNVANASIGSPMRHGVGMRTPVATVHVVRAPVVRTPVFHTPVVRHHGFHGHRFGYRGFRAHRFGHRFGYRGFRGHRFGHRGFRGRRFGFCTRCGR